MKTLVPPIITIAPPTTTITTNTATRTRRKKVRFAGHDNHQTTTIIGYVPCRSEWTLQESENIWFTPAEMREFRHAAKKMSKETKGTTWMIQCVEEAFNTARQIASSCSDETQLEETLQQHSFTTTPRDDLVDWCRYGHSRRGLERWSCKVHKDAREDAAQKARKRVLEMQKCNDEFLRRISERFSRSARVFARLIGQADALASAMSSSSSSSSSSSPLLLTDSSHHKQSQHQHSQHEPVVERSRKNVSLADTAWKDAKGTPSSSQYHAVCA